MDLKELSAEYRKSAKLLSDRLSELRQALKEAQDPEQIWHIKQRIAQLTPMLTQMNEVADLTEHYYERGYWRSERISSNAFRDGQPGGIPAQSAVAIDHYERADGKPTGYIPGLLCEGAQHTRNRKAKRRKQEHSLKKFAKSRRKDQQDHFVPLGDQDIDDILASFLQPKGTRNGHTHQGQPEDPPVDGN